MRWLLLPLLSLGGLAGCAGHVADYVGPRSSIIATELIRYGFGATQSRCVGQQLGTSLTPRQLRRFERIAATVPHGYYESERLTVRDLVYVASTMSDPQVRLELSRATDTCGVSTEIAAAPPTPQPAPVAAPRAPAWLNLGAAPTGQAIAVDASTLEQDATMRKAWFRLTNPGETQPLANAYLLRIDCAHRTIQALAHRRQDQAGAVSDYHEYVAETEGPMPVEGGTVMEIAFLAMCT